MRVSTNEPQPMTRRQLLQVGGIGMLGLGLPDLLRASSPGAVDARGAGSAKSCIFIMQYGGASQIDSWDLKPEAPAEIRGPYRPIATRVPGMQVCELMPRLAALTDRCCLIRSMTHRNPDHGGAVHICLTGSSKPADNAPHFGSVIAKLRPPKRNVPPYVWLQNLDSDAGTRYLHGGFLGEAHAPLLVGRRLDNPSAPGFRMKEFDPSAEVTPSRMRQRHQLLQQMDGHSNATALPSAAQMRKYQERAVELVTGPEARQAFDLEREPAGVRDRYGRHPLGQNLLMARRLIEAGVRLVSVNAWVGFPANESLLYVQTWDMHGAVGNGQGSIFGTQARGLGFALPLVDMTLTALLEDLEVRGLLESTLVVVVGEFGRTPTITKNPVPGRDHWPHCYSALLAGGGIRGGSVYGASDRNGAYVKDRPVWPEDFGATLFHTLGVPPGTRLGADGFTHPASTGQVIEDLLG
jgi:Protein of unknown function (DUF1501)